MRSRRLIKKISKKLAPYFKGAWISTFKDELYYKDEWFYKFHTKGIFHVGGGLDYWGEGEEAYTVLEAAEQAFWGWQSFCGCKVCQNQFDPDSRQEICPESERRKKLSPTLPNLILALTDNT